MPLLGTEIVSITREIDQRKREKISLCSFLFFSSFIFYLLYKKSFLVISISKNFPKNPQIHKNVDLLIEINLFNKVHDKIFS